MTDAEIDAIGGTLDRVFADAHVTHWPEIAGQLAMHDRATPEDLRQVERALLGDYIVWREEVLSSLRRWVRATETIH